MCLSGYRPGCILPTGSWEGSYLNRFAKGVICLPSAEHYELITDIKLSYIHIYISYKRWDLLGLTVMIKKFLAQEYTSIIHVKLESSSLVL